MLRWSWACAVACAMVALAPVAPNAGVTRQETFEPLVTTVGSRAFDAGYDSWYYISVVFESRVEATDDGFEYRYRLTNKGDAQVRVEWRAVEESAFGDAVDNIEELRVGLLDPGAESDWLVLESPAAPTVSERPARMFGSAPSGNESVPVSGRAPAYVPQ